MWSCKWKNQAKSVTSQPGECVFVSTRDRERKVCVCVCVWLYHRLLSPPQTGD